MTCYKSEPPSSPLSSHFFPLLFSFSPSSFCGLLMSPQHVAPEHSPEPLIRRTIWSILTDIYNHPSVVNHVIPGQFVIEFVTSHAQGPPYSRRRCLSDLLNYNYEEINDPGTSKLHPPCGICRESYLVWKIQRTPTLHGCPSQRTDALLTAHLQRSDVAAYDGARYSSI